MPHIRLNCSACAFAQVDVDALLASLVETLSALPTVNPSAIKAYAFCHDNWAMGAGAPHGFAHCELAILSGRPDELRVSMAQALLTTMKRHFHDPAVGVTVEVREMDSLTYQK